MRIYFRVRLLSSLIVGLLFILSNNGSFAADKYNFQKSEIEKKEGLDEKDYPAEKSIKRKASSSGFVKHYLYYYYPSSNVYYSVDRKMYYYLEDDNWKICAFLPSDLNKRLDEYVRLELDTQKPYIYHKQHIAKFAQEESDKKKKSFLARVIYIMLYKH